MIGGNFSLQVSVSSGNAQMVGLDPARGTPLGAESPAKSMLITCSFGDSRSCRCASGFPYCTEISHCLCSAQKMKAHQGNSLPQIHTQFFLKRFIKSGSRIRQETNK